MPVQNSELRTQNLATIALAAVRSQRQNGAPEIFAIFTAAQCVLESDCLRKMPVESNNCFGIKDTDRQPGCVYCFTKEWISGKEQTLKLAFERYPDLADCFADHALLLTGGFAPNRSNCYRAHWDMFLRDGDFSDFIAGISAHYATGKGYAAAVRNGMREPALIAAIEAARKQMGGA